MKNDAARSVDIIFQGGVRQDLESRTTPPGVLLNCDNLEFDKLNRLVRRDGFAPIGTTKFSKTATLTFPVRRTAEGPDGSRLLFNDTTVFAHFPAVDKVSEAGIPGARYSPTAALTDVHGITADEAGTLRYMDCAATGIYAVYSYLQFDLTGVYFCYADIVDTTTNARIISQLQLGVANATAQTRVVSSTGSSVVFVVWCSGAASLSYAKFDLAVGSISPTIGSLVTDCDVTLLFDVAPMASGWALAYAKLSGTSSVQVSTYNATPAVQATANWVPAGAWQPTAISILGDLNGTRAYVTGYDSGATLLRGVTYAAGLTAPANGNYNPGVASPIRQLTIGRRGVGAATVASSEYASAVAPNPRGHINMAAFTDAAAFTSFGAFFNYSIGSKFYRDSRSGGLFALGRFDDPSGFQNHFLLLDFGNTNGGYDSLPVPILHVASGRVQLSASNAYTGVGGVADLSAVQAGKFQFAFLVNIGASQASGAQVQAYTFQSLSTRRFLSTHAQLETVVAGGTPMSFDGQRSPELSFYSYPAVQAASFTPSNVGGSLAQGKYQYRVVYEWTSANGNRHQSPASPAVTVDMSGGGFAAGTNLVTVSVPTVVATKKQIPGVDKAAPVCVVLYRTLVNGQDFFRATVTPNNQTSTTNAVVDTLSDAFVGANEILYDGPGGQGILATTAPPPSLFVTTHAQRLCGVDGENPERIWFTKVLSDRVAPSYSPALQVLIPGAGKINGLGSQDGKLYALAVNGIYLATYGDGPSDTGIGSFPSPQLITTSATCDEPRGVLVGEDGIYFTGRDQWGSGIYLIRRGDGEPLPIGRRVRDELAMFPICRGVVARIVKARTEFLFVDSDTAPTGGVLLYYYHDYLDSEGMGQWTVTRVSGGEALECIGEWADVTVVADATQVSIQTPGTARDLGSTIPIVNITTCDIRAAGLVGFPQLTGITLLGSKGTDDGLNIAASYDSGFSWADSAPFDVSPESVGAPVLRRFETATQKLSDGGSVRIQITDGQFGETPPGTTYFHGVALEFVPLGGNARLPNQKRA